MRWRIRNQKDFAAGLIYIVAGAGFSLGALEYRMGDPARMGPGFFPFWIGVLLALVGIVTVAAGLKPTAVAERIHPPQLGPVAWIISAVVLFGLLLNTMGLVVALTTLILVSARASHEFTWRGTLASVVVLNLFCIGVFIYGINLQIDLWPSWLQ